MAYIARLIAVTATFSFVLLHGGCAPINCHNGREAGMNIKFFEDGVHNICNTDRDGRNIDKSRFCRWNFQLKPPAQLASILLEKRRGTDYHEVVRGDAMPNLTMTLIKNGKEVRRDVWNKRNMSLIRISQDELLRIEQRIENASALDSALYLSLTVAVLSYGDTGKAHRSSATQRYVVRPVEFVCGSLPVENCSMLTALAAQFNSAEAIQAFVDSASEELISLLANPVLLGLHCCNGSVVYYQEGNSSNSSSQWLQVSGDQHFNVCSISSVQPVKFLTLRTAIKNTRAFSFQLDGVRLRRMASNQQVLLDLHRIDKLERNVTWTWCKDDSAGQSTTLRSVLLTVGCIILVVILVALLGICLYIRYRSVDNTERYEQVPLERVHTK